VFGAGRDCMKGAMPFRWNREVRRHAYPGLRHAEFLYRVPACPTRRFDQALGVKRLTTVGAALGAAFLFDPDDGDFLQEIDDIAPNRNDGFGGTVALDGSDALVGAQGDLVGSIRPGEVFAYSTLATVPEAGTLMLLPAGLAALVLVRWRAAASRS
jgi:hypothetical protein